MMIRRALKLVRRVRKLDTIILGLLTEFIPLGRPGRVVASLSLIALELRLIGAGNFIAERSASRVVAKACWLFVRKRARVKRGLKAFLAARFAENVGPRYLIEESLRRSSGRSNSFQKGVILAASVHHTFAVLVLHAGVESSRFTLGFEVFRCIVRIFEPVARMTKSIVVCIPVIRRTSMVSTTTRVSPMRAPL